MQRSALRLLWVKGYAATHRLPFDQLGLTFMFPVLVALAWMYVVVLMAAAEATSPDGSIIGAVFTLLLYGIVPLAVTLYLLNTRSRRAARKSAPVGTVSAPPDNSSHAAGDAVAAERKVP